MAWWHIHNPHEVSPFTGFRRGAHSATALSVKSKRNMPRKVLDFIRAGRLKKR